MEIKKEKFVEYIRDHTYFKNSKLNFTDKQIEEIEKYYPSFIQNVIGRLDDEIENDDKVAINNTVKLMLRYKIITILKDELKPDDLNMNNVEFDISFLDFIRPESA